MRRTWSDGSEFVGEELVVVVEAKCNASSGWLKGFGVDVLDGGNKHMGLMRILLRVAAAIKEEVDL